MFNDRSRSLAVKRKSYGKIMVPTVTFGAKTRGVWMDERRKTNFMETKRLQNM